MEVHIFDVEHGSCNAIVAPSGNLLLIDCGHNDTTGWRPWSWVASRRLPVANLTISNFDEDHLTDLPNLRRTARIQSLTVNWNLTPDWVRRSKRAGMGPGVTAAVEMMQQYGGGQPASIDWGGCSISNFYHSPSLFDDENSLSVVTFIHYEGIRMVFPGDLTERGWRAFLGDASFRLWLERTNIFVASHHGRIDGYCPEVFSYCRPSVVIISDKSIMYDTQQVDYGQHATGIRWNSSQVRYCLTTRNDGKLAITPTSGGGFWIQAGG